MMGVGNLERAVITIQVFHCSVKKVSRSKIMLSSLWALFHNIDNTEVLILTFILYRIKAKQKLSLLVEEENIYQAGSCIMIPYLDLNYDVRSCIIEQICCRI